MKLRTLLSFSAVIPFMALADVPANYPGLPFTEDGKAPVVPADGTELVVKANDFDYVPGTEAGKANEVVGQGKTYFRTSKDSYTNTYRPALPLNIKPDGSFSTNQGNGDWSCYTLEFPSDGLYVFGLTGGSGANNSFIYFSIDGDYNESGEYAYNVSLGSDYNKGHRENPDRVCEDVKVENLGWEVFTAKYETFTVPVTAGKHVVRMHFHQDGTNHQNIYVSRVADMPEENYPFANLEVKDGAEIYFRDYDRGGEGKAYHNVYNQNYKGNGTYNRSYWLGDEIEINGQGGVGNASYGEWMAYTVNVTEAGAYTIELLSASPSDNRSYQYMVDRRMTYSGVANKSANGWDDYSALSEVDDVQLSKGVHEIRFYTTGDFNVMKMTFFNRGGYDPTKAEYQGEPFTDHSIPGIIEAENFDKGGQDVAFNNPRHDANDEFPDGRIFNGTDYREDADDAVDMERKTFTENEQQVERLYLHYMNGDKWFNYTFNNEDGEYPYKMYACIATHNLNDNTAYVTVKFHHDMTKEYSSNVFLGQGWDKFSEVEFPNDVKLPAGQVTMHVSTPANLDYIRFKSTNPSVNTGIEDIAAEGHAVVISGEGTIRVEGYEGVVEVIAVNGMTVARAAASETIRVAAGLYIVRAGAQAFKVAVR